MIPTLNDLIDRIRTMQKTEPKRSVFALRELCRRVASGELDATLHGATAQFAAQTVVILLDHVEKNPQPSPPVLTLVLDDDTSDEAIYRDGELMVSDRTLHLCDVAYNAGYGLARVDFVVTRCNGDFPKRLDELQTLERADEQC